MSELLRHIQACNNTTLPGGRVPFRLAGQEVGWLEPRLARRLGSETAVSLQPEQLQPTVRALADEGWFRWRDEAFDVRAEPNGPALAQLDRGALPAFGVEAAGAHLNGLVGATRLWIARRAAHKALDPGKLDHIAAGGVSAGHTPESTLIKEAEEEAGIPPELARQARPVATIAYTMQRPEGLRRDRIYCFDLALPPSFTPVARDGEVEGFELWELRDVLEAVRRTDAFKFNVNLVLIELFLRLGLIEGEEAETLRAAIGRL